MEEKWLELYRKLEKIEENFLDIEKRNDLVPIQECMLEIQSFAVWFLEKINWKKRPKNGKKKRESFFVFYKILLRQLSSRIMS